MVCYKSETEAIVGQSAVNQAARHLENTIFDSKRVIGRSFSDENVTKDRDLWPFTLVDNGEDRPQFKVSNGYKVQYLFAEQVSAKILE